MKLQDSDIISAARDLRDEQNDGLHVSDSPIRSHRQPTPLWWAATAAALAVGFVLGKAPSSVPFWGTEGATDELALKNDTTEAPLVAKEASPAIIREVIHEVVHDTIYETRIVRVPVQQTMTAQAPADPAPASPGCSMLCDEIPYELLAGN